MKKEFTSQQKKNQRCVKWWREHPEKNKVKIANVITKAAERHQKIVKQLEQGIIPDTRVCTQCGKSKKYGEFGLRKVSRDGWCTICKQCVREKARLKGRPPLYNKQKAKIWRNKRGKKIRLWIENYKKTLVCSLCQENKTKKLVFHHENPENKRFKIAQGVQYSIESVKREIAKCVILCRECHDELHNKEGVA